MSDVDYIKSIVNGFNNLDTFEDQIKFLSLNNKELCLCLDEDFEYIDFIDKQHSNLSRSNCLWFIDLRISEHIGNKKGALALLDMLGVTNISFEDMPIS